VFRLLARVAAELRGDDKRAVKLLEQSLEMIGPEDSKRAADSKSSAFGGGGGAGAGGAKTMPMAHRVEYQKHMRDKVFEVLVPLLLRQGDAKRARPLVDRWLARLGGSSDGGGGVDSSGLIGNEQEGFVTQLSMTDLLSLTAAAGPSGMTGQQLAAAARQQRQQQQPKKGADTAYHLPCLTALAECHFIEKDFEKCAQVLERKRRVESRLVRAIVCLHAHRSFCIGLLLSLLG
jgi:hypothetical protein